MKTQKIVIDTNALISFVTDRNVEQQLEVAPLFEKAANLDLLLLCPQNVLTEFVHVLDNVYGVEKSLIKQMLEDLTLMPGVQVVHEIDFTLLFSYWPDQIPDLGDAIVASVCKATTNAAIVTFDRKFKKVLDRLAIPSI